MPRNERARQKSLQKHAARRKQKKQALIRSVPPGETKRPAFPRTAAMWPLHECLLAEGWETTTQLSQLVVARQSPLGEIAGASFLIDLACLGVKDAFSELFGSRFEYERLLRTPATERFVMRPVDVNLAAKLVREAVAYARSLGFKPNPDYYRAAVLLEGADPDAVDTPIPLGGEDGKPYFIAGPYDHIEQSIAILNRSVGQGNYHITYGPTFLPGAAPFDLDDTEDEDEEFALEEDDEEDEPDALEAEYELNSYPSEPPGQ